MYFSSESFSRTIIVPSATSCTWTKLGFPQRIKRVLYLKSKKVRYLRLYYFSEQLKVISMTCNAHKYTKILDLSCMKRSQMAYISFCLLFFLFISWVEFLKVFSSAF